MNSRAEDATAKIRETFQDATYPGDDNIVTDGGHDPECREIEDGFKGKAWASISPRTVLQYKDALPLLTPAAFRYYLPAYLIACLEAPEEIDVAWDNVIFNLTPPKQQERLQREFRARTEEFTVHQVEALVAFLEFVNEREQAESGQPGMAALEDRVRPALEYWKARPRK